MDEQYEQTHVEKNIPIKATGSAEPMDMSIHIIPSILSLLLIGLLSSVIVLSARHRETVLAQESTDRPITIGTHFNMFSSLPLKAKAVYVYDVKEKRVLYAKNEEAQLPLASLTKIMMAATIAEMVPDYTVVSVPGQTATGTKKVSYAIMAGDKFKLKDLLAYTLTISSNEGATLIASVGATSADHPNQPINQEATSTVTFVDQMNIKAKKIGMDQSYFLNESGLDVSAVKSGGYGSAKDMAILFEYMLANHPDILEATTYSDVSVPTLSKDLRTAVNTNILVKNTPRVLASKTGLTDLAGGNLVMVIDADLAHPIIIAELGSTETGRFEDMKMLIKATEKILNMEP